MGDKNTISSPSHQFQTKQGWKKAGDLTTEDFLRTLSKDQQITEIFKKKLASKIKVYNLSVMGCHTYAVGKTGVIVHNGCYYRGGDSFKAREIDVKRTKEGLVQTTHGVSLNTDKSQLSRFSKISQVDSIPDSLRIIQRGKSPTHYEIIPKFSMTFEKFNEELSKIIFHIVK